MTYLPHSGAFYHSWYNRFTIRKGNIEPGPISRAKCAQLYKASLLHVDHCDRSAPKKDMELVIFWPPDGYPMEKAREIVEKNVAQWQQQKSNDG